ncbi:MAG: hypothetical protein ACXVH7_04385 [Thermoanaerobaculia bacterium]
MNNERDDALSSANCPNCHAPYAVPSAPIPPQFDGGKTDHPEFNACKECGMLYADMAIALKKVARDEPAVGQGQRSGYRKIATVVAIFGAVIAGYFASIRSAVGFEVVAVITALIIFGLVFVKKPERGSRRASGMANDQ